MNKCKQDWIEALQLSAHPEGGYFKETYRSTEDHQVLDSGDSRSCGTSIYFLLGKGDVSHFHKIKSDELWNYHTGDSCVIHVFDTNGIYYQQVLGTEFDQGEVLQFIVPAGCVFASESTGDYSLVGCVVVPGFDFQDFKLFTTKELGVEYPDKMDLIKKFTKEKYG